VEEEAQHAANLRRHQHRDLRDHALHVQVSVFVPFVLVKKVN
jgi:hypothetical protein